MVLYITEITFYNYISLPIWLVIFKTLVEGIVLPKMKIPNLEQLEGE